MEELDDIRCEMISNSEESMKNADCEAHWRAKDQVGGSVGRMPIFNGVSESMPNERYALLGRDSLEDSPYHGADRSAT